MLNFLSQYYNLIICGTIGTLGFCMLFNVQKRRLLYGCLGGFITSLCYCICAELGMSVLIQNMLSAIAGALYAEIAARIIKAPAVVFLIPSVIPLTPGGSLYYTMNALVDGDMQGAEHYAARTLLIAVGIAVGIVFVSVIFYQINRLHTRVSVINSKPWQHHKGDNNL